MTMGILSKKRTVDSKRFVSDVDYRREFLFGDCDRSLLDRFRKFDLENPDVYSKFVGLSTTMAKKGRTAYSAWAIINKIRWDHDIETEGDVFKISNDFIGLYARKLILNQPAMLVFFDIKPMKRERSTSAERKARIDSGMKSYKELETFL